MKNAIRKEALGKRDRIPHELKGHKRLFHKAETSCIA